MSNRSENYKMFGAIALVGTILLYSFVIFGEGQRFVNPMDVLFRWFFGMG
jgi:hypothetical protein